MPLTPLLHLAWGHAWRRPLQSLLFVVGVAIGVAMIVAIDLANGSAERAFALGTETVTGRATHQITGGPSGLDETVYTDLRTRVGYRLSAPVVESYVVADALDAQPMRLLGVDPFAEPPFRSYLGPGDQAQAPAASFLRELMVTPGAVLLSTDVAARYGLKAGDPLTIRSGTDKTTLTIAGLLQPADDLSRRALDGLIVADIATAQEVLGKVGKLSRIDLIVPEGQGAKGEENDTLRAIQSILPPGARIDATAARAGTVNDMTAAFRLNLTALSLLALVVGMFLIYNTVTFSVVQRRPVLGSLRALGMTRREIFALILGEAGLLGLLGTALGLGLGVILGRGAVQLVTQTVNDLFFVVAVREIEIPALTLIKGGVIGVAAALLGAAVPAWEATSVPPAGALKRSDVEERTRRALPRVSIFALVLLGVGAVLLLPLWDLVVTFAGLFAIVVGAALLTPVLTLWIMAGVQRLVRNRGGVIERMAPRTIVRSLSRIAVAVAALMVSVSVIIGVGIMIGSFRQTVVLWLDDVLQADIYISSPSLNSNVAQTTLKPALLDEVRAIPGISRTATTRSVDVTGQVAAGGEAIPLRLVSLSAGPGRAGSPLPLGVGRLAGDLAGGRAGQHLDQRANGESIGAEGGRHAAHPDRPRPAPFPHRRRHRRLRRALGGLPGRCSLSPRLGRRPDFGHRPLCGARRGRGRHGGRHPPGLCRQDGALGAIQPGHARKCAGGVRPHLRHHRGSPTAGRPCRLYRHPQHTHESAVGAHARNRRAPCDRADASPVVATFIVGNGAGGCDRRAVSHTYRFCARPHPHLHHQSALVWMDAGDALAAHGVRAGVSCGAGRRAAGGSLPSLAHGANAAGGRAAVGVRRSLLMHFHRTTIVSEQSKAIQCDVRNRIYRFKRSRLCV